MKLYYLVNPGLLTWIFLLPNREHSFYNIYKQMFVKRGAIMKNQLLKAMQRNQLVDMMYISKSGEITKRRIKVTKIVDDSFSAYCFTRHAKRTFKIENVLAVMPVLNKERIVV